MKWTRKETTLLLELYLKYKDAIPEWHSMRNSKILHVIVEDMKEHGISTTYLKLDRKLRNMKRTYNDIKQKKRDASKWEYFHAMEEIFGGSTNQTIDLTSSEEEETESEKKMVIKAEPSDVFANELMDESNFGDMISDRTTNEDQDVDVDGPYMNLAEELEVQRLEELRLIRATLQESNIIQRERNQILLERNKLMRQFLTSTLRNNKHV